MRSTGVAGGRLMAWVFLLAGLAGVVGCDIENDSGAAAQTSGTVTLTVSQSRFDFLLDMNSDAADPALTQPLLLNNNNGTLVDWAIVTDSPWIFISQSDGQITTESDEVGVSILLNQLTPGLHKGTITIIENTGTSAGTQEVVVIVRICEGACISVNTANTNNHIVSPLLFGSQTEYLNSGTSVWDSITTNDCNDPAMPVGIPHQEQLDEFLQLGIGFLRYPSGIPSDFFHWNESVGPVASRTPQINPWDTLSDTDLIKQCPVFGPDEFAEFADLLSAPIFITTNVGTGTAQEAADWLDYYESKGVNAEYWEIGNEIYIEGTAYLFSTYMQPLEYATAFDAHAVALRQVNPNAKVGLVMAPMDQDWNMGVMGAITEPFDFITLHSFQPQIDTCSEFSDEEVYKSLLASTLLMETQLEFIRETAQQLAPSNGPPTFSISEWGPWFLHVCEPGSVPDNDARGRTMASALFSGLAWNSMMRDPSIFSAFHTALSSSKAQATLNIVFRNGEWVPTRSAHYFVQKLYTESIGGTVIPTLTRNSPTYTAKFFDNAARAVLPVLDSIAVLSDDESRLYVYVVNRGLTNNVDFQLFAEGLPNTVTSIVTDTVVSSSFSGENTADVPDAVVMETNTLAIPANGELSLTLQAHSLVRITLSMTPPSP